MNELQKVEFELFVCFDEICKKIGVDYFLLCGSALGAVRHNGFIPWDDDFDVGMYRDDYSKFMDLAPALLPEGIFLQNYKSDPFAPFNFAKLRNSNTTFIEKSISKLDMNHGIYMDIFPLDGYPKETNEQKKLSVAKKNFARKLICAYDAKFSIKGKILVFVLRLLGYHKRTAKTLSKYEAFVSKYMVEESDIICSHGNKYGEKDYIPKEYYGNGTYATFQGVRVRIPEKYDEYLTCLYGDWHTPPPEDERKEIHPCEVMDTTKSYLYYMKKDR